MAALLLLVTVCATVMSAQTATMTHPEKMSISTQMFLDEMAGNLTFDNAPSGRLNMPGQPQLLQEVERRYAAPEFIDGKAFISAFVWVAGDEDVASLQREGVIVEERFDDGLMTTLIPVDRINEVAAIPGVKRIEVATMMQPATDIARRTTFAADVLSYSDAAVAAGLPGMYDGNGVIVGVVDRGIDYDHIAFQDKDGNTRIKRAYVYNGSSAIYYYGEGPLPKDNVTNTDHGSHTSAIAGGSSVIVDDTLVTVTDDHANATYGGMAPGAELFLCGLNGMTDARVANAFKRICNYADSVGKPVVLSNSYGDYVYNRDGGGSLGQIVSQLFGEQYPNRICVFATGNNAGHSGGAPGGVYVSGPASAEAPLGTIVCSTQEAYDAGWLYYRQEYIADAFTRARDAEGIGVIIHVLNNETGEVVASYNYESSGGNRTLQLPDYFTAHNDRTPTVAIYFDYRTGKGCKQVILYTQYGLKSPIYTLGVEVYPIGGSSDIIDMWSCGNYTYFDNHLTTEGHTWTVGSDDMSVMPNACYPEVISAGSYVTRPTSESNSAGDISRYSCYAVEGMGPLGAIHPWISAPGEEIISAFNHYVNRTSGGEDIVVHNSNYMYGLMSGTSMAAPMVAGIVALWMQAATDCGKQLTLSEVKQIMQETAIKDEWVMNGPNATHFGNGKIDALAGVKYILEQYGGHDYEVGDVNHDGDINITDVTDLIDYLLDGDVELCPVCVDVTADGVVDINDVTGLIDQLLSGN
jgi:hypothetical protein